MSSKLKVSAIIILISALLASPALAAKLVRADVPQDIGLQKFADEFLALESLMVSADANLSVRTFDVVKRARTETWENTLKQAIYILRGSDAYSRPEEVIVKASSKKSSDILAAIRNAGTFLDESELEDVILQVAAPLQSALRNFELLLFTGNDGNSFGGCQHLAVVDREHMQLMIAETCYGE